MPQGKARAASPSVDCKVLNHELYRISNATGAHGMHRRNMYVGMIMCMCHSAACIISVLEK